jgi:hypothetical protein
MDIVYPLKTYPSQDLLYSVRSIAENLPHNKVFFAGGYPVWAKDVIYVPTTQNGHKWSNAKGNINTACEWDMLSDDFILMNDDFYLMRPIDELKNYHNGIIKEMVKRFPLSSYRKRLEKTQEYLESIGITEPVSFELHLPITYNKEKLKFVQTEHNPKGDYATRSIYGNLYLTEAEYLEKDVKKYDKDHTIGDDETWVSSSDRFIATPEFRKIRYKYKVKCRYEYGV